MKNTKLLLCCAFSALVLGGAAHADWNPGDGHKMHYPQLPDLTPTGLDVNASMKGLNTVEDFRKTLADDFRCSESGPIQDIHIWGSWLNDQVYNLTRFKLTIYSDIPAVPGNPNSYSRPGAPLWERTFNPDEYVKRIYSSGPERFYDPKLNQMLGTDNNVWQYNFANFSNPFIQQEGTIYWLGVQALTSMDTAFGWKTTNPAQTPHFMDDAVFGENDIFAGPLNNQFPNPDGPGLIPWKDMHYPDGPFQGQSIDLAFVITPEPASITGLALCGLLLKRRK